MLQACGTFTHTVFPNHLLAPANPSSGSSTGGSCAGGIREQQQVQGRRFASPGHRLLGLATLFMHAFVRHRLTNCTALHLTGVACRGGLRTPGSY